MASYDKSKDPNYTLAVQSALKTLGANLGAGGVDGKWGAYTERAYQQNRQAVDALVSGLGFTSAGSFAGAEAGGGLAPQFTPQLVDVPEQRSFSDWLAVGQEIYAAQYEAGRQSAQRRLEAAQAANEENRVQCPPRAWRRRQMRGASAARATLRTCCSATNTSEPQRGRPAGGLCGRAPATGGGPQRQRRPVRGQHVAEPAAGRARGAALQRAAEPGGGAAPVGGGKRPAQGILRGERGLRSKRLGERALVVGEKVLFLLEQEGVQRGAGRGEARVEFEPARTAGILRR